MAQKDYVSRSKKSGQPKKTTSKRKQSTATRSSYKAWLLLVVVVGAFIAGLYFLKTNKQNKPVATPQQTTSNKTNGKVNNVPPLPEKRWGYPDALTNPGANRNKPGAGMSVEQQRILAEMAADRPQQTKTSSTYNEQVGRNSQTSTNQPTTTSTNQPTTTTTSRPANTNATTAAKPATSTPTSTTSKSWTLQCGAFRNKDGAESIKAQLALTGISSQIIFSNNLHRVVIGPFTSPNAANSMQTRTQNAGVSGCSVRG